MAVRNGGQPRCVTVDRAQACAAFRSESLFEPRGWPRPTTDGRINATYRCADGWIRLHASYDWHHTAALDVLGLSGDVDRTMVAEVVAGWRGEDLESAVIAAGRCAALMRTPEEWRAHPAGAALSVLPAVVKTTRGSGTGHVSRSPSRPLEGVRVLDLRVIAGRPARGSSPLTVHTYCASTRRTTRRSVACCRS